MPKNDNPHAVRLMNSLIAAGKKEAAATFAEAHPLSKSADFQKKFEWANNLCTFLDAQFDDALVKEIRMNCACGTEMGKATKLKAIYEKANDPAEFVEKANKLELGFMLAYESEAFYLIYPTCYCSCLKRVDAPLSKTWCYCTLGYTKRLMENVFDRSINVELISSIKQGDPECRIRITMMA